MPRFYRGQPRGEGQTKMLDAITCPPTSDVTITTASGEVFIVKAGDAERRRHRVIQSRAPVIDGNTGEKIGEWLGFRWIMD